MAPITYETILSSRPFRFLVGPQKRQFMLHSAIVAHQSKALDRLINGAMKEAKDGYAIWDEVDEQTFIRFSQFVYTNDYITPPPAQLAKPHKSQQTQWSKPHGAAILWTRFMKDLELASGSLPVADFYPPTNQPTEDFTDILLCHAKMYVFADYYGIVPLQALALHKLRLTLDNFVLYDNKAGEIANLVQYTYENTPPSMDLHGLREHVVVYVASNMEGIWKDEGMPLQNLIENGGEFARDLIGMLVKKESSKSTTGATTIYERRP